MGSKYKTNRPAFAKRSLGQNFLVDENHIRKIVAALGNIENDLIIEVGPGRGALTELLVGNCKRFVGIELDTHLSALLETKYSDVDEVTIVESDILNTDIEKLAGPVGDCESVKLVANLPYNISTPVLQKTQRPHIVFVTGGTHASEGGGCKDYRSSGKQRKGILDRLYGSVF